MYKTSNILGSTLNFFNSVQAGLKSRLFGFNPNTREYWNRKLSRFDGSWRSDHYELILDLLPEDTAFSLLDVGCALGDGCELIKDTYPQSDITGIDFSEVGIGEARRNNGQVNFLIRDILNDPLSGKYDYITIIQTLEHFDDPFMVVDKCLEHTRDSLIVSTPYNQSLALSIGEHRYRFDEHTFERYNCHIAKLTDFSASLGYKCIVYQIKPE